MQLVPNLEEKGVQSYVVAIRLKPECERSHLLMWQVAGFVDLG